MWKIQNKQKNFKESKNPLWSSYKAYTQLSTTQATRETQENTQENPDGTHEEKS